MIEPLRAVWRVWRYAALAAARGVLALGPGGGVLIVGVTAGNAYVAALGGPCSSINWTLAALNVLLMTHGAVLLREHGR